MTKIVTFGFGGYDPSKPNNNLVDVVDVVDVQIPLNTSGVMATLNAVLGLWSLQDAANAVGLTEQDLINEAQAWAVGAQNGN